MKLVRAAVLLSAVALCLDKGGQEGAAAPTLPAEAVSAIKQTPCPTAAGLSPEQCLIWLGEGRAQSSDVAQTLRDLERGQAAAPNVDPRTIGARQSERHAAPSAKR